MTTSPLRLVYLNKDSQKRALESQPIFGEKMTCFLFCAGLKDDTNIILALVFCAGIEPRVTKTHDP